MGFGKNVSAQTLDCFVLSPAENYFAGVNKIAILNFENFNKDSYYSIYGGTAFVDYLTASLLDETRGITPVSGGLFGSKVVKSYIKSSSINVFRIIEREQLDKVLKEKNLGSHTTLNENQAAEIGRVLGIDAIVTGSIRYGYNSSRTFTAGKSGTKYYTTENKCETEVTVKTISVANAQIMSTKTFSFVSKDSKSGAEESKVMVFNDLAPRNLKVLSQQISSYLAPHYIFYKARFEKIKEVEFREKIKSVENYLDNGDIKSAWTVYKAIYDADNYNAPASYNLAQLHFVTGDYKGALEWMEIAYQIDAKEYGKQYESSVLWADYGKFLEDSGISIEKYNFTAKDDALAKRVKTAGKKSDRHEVYENPNGTGAVVAKVPGDTEFVVIEEKAGAVKIKLLGGKEGYISRGSLR
ncbi:MAG: CsgG/HfaB family protein [Candidatus Pacebacteria bacterium]|nr:CsgG/HfaB family protein [Candidatus Paceibacterota bacterium]